MVTKFQKLLTFILLLVTVELASVNTLSYIQHFRYTPDGLENITSTINLIQHGSISLDGLYGKNNLAPSDSREPLPILLNALWIKLHPDLNKLTTLEEFKQQKNADKFRYQNVVYIAILLVGIYLLTFKVVSRKLNYWPSVATAIATLLIAYASFPFLYVNCMFTEYIAEALIVFFVWAWLCALLDKKTVFYGVAGIFLGLLLLTKAAVVYIANGVLIFILLWMLLNRFKKDIIYKHLLILLVANLMVMPWYARNYMQLGEWAYSSRGASVLLARAYYDRMTDEEYIGGYFAYAPECMKKIMMKLTGFTHKDRFNGGRLERLRRYPQGDLVLRAKGDEENAIGYVTKSSTHIANATKKNRLLYADGVTVTKVTEREMKKEAFNLISNNLGGHVRNTFLMAWKGAWPSNKDDGVWDVRTKPLPTWTQLLPFFGLLSMIYLFFSGLFHKHIESVALSALGVAQFAFYALITHFLPRYSEMFIAIWVICLVTVCVSFVSKLQEWNYREL